MGRERSNSAPVMPCRQRFRGERRAWIGWAALWQWIGRGAWALPLLCLVIGCQAKLAVSDAMESGVSVVLTTNKQTYASGEPIELTLALMNGDSQPLTLRFMTAQRYDFTIHDRRGQQVWRWSAERFFAQVLGEETIPPGNALSYRVTVRQSFPAGQYTVTGVIPTAEGRVSASLHIEIR